MRQHKLPPQIEGKARCSIWPHKEEREEIMPLGDGIRRNAATVSPEERKLLRDAFRALDAAPFRYSDGITYWDKQEDVHKDAHEAGQDVHRGPAFLPWHRVICGKVESLLRQVDPRLSLHYWDWSTDPRASPDGNGGIVNLMTPDFMGDDGSQGINRLPADGGGDVGPPFQDFETTEGAVINLSGAMLSLGNQFSVRSRCNQIMTSSQPAIVCPP
jgi:Common central domain of tyrosinase